MKYSELFIACHTLNYDHIGTDVDYKFVEKGDDLYIYFKGSDSKWDWFFNFFFFKQIYKNNKKLKVHRGFALCYLQVHSLIVKKIREMTKTHNYRWKNIYIVGYSHGGALAQLAHETCCYYRGSDVVKTYCFESPRVWHTIDKETASIVGKNIFLFETNWDLVAHCPPRLFGFKDVGKKIHIETIEKCGIIKSHYPESVFEALKEWEKEFFND